MNHRITAALAAALLFTVGCGGGGGNSASHKLAGDLTLGDVSLVSDDVGGPCSGSGGYDDVTGGATVTVKNADGKIVATGQLGKGTRIPLNGSHDVSEQCQFPITVDKVPDSAFYQVEVSHRGPQTYNKDDLDKADWQVHLTLGNRG